MIPATIRVAFALLAAGTLAGCANSAGSQPKFTAKEQAQARAIAQLAKDMPAGTVRDLLGKPDTVKPVDAAGLHGEIWSYPLRTQTEANTVAATTWARPAVNPLTGRDTTVTEPVYQIETVSTTDTLYVMIVEDRVVEWRIIRKSDRAIR